MPSTMSLRATRPSVAPQRAFHNCAVNAGEGQTARGLAAEHIQLVPEHCDLIREMSIANPLWGAPRIHGELRKLGIDVGP